ncbi:MAG: helix-turn-helix domain-containing protein [Candidatus Omnitrophica bacterium]|nr:helix-turn-helix domain-containing protein [Candidatus Omnitrophota bacterium]
MTEEKMLTVRDVSIMLGVSEKDVLDLTENGTIPGYKVGGVYLRFKKDQVEQYKKSQSHLKPETIKGEPDGLISRVHDFFYFNDFYIFSLIFIILLGYLVYRGL